MSIHEPKRQRLISLEDDDSSDFISMENNRKPLRSSISCAVCGISLKGLTRNAREAHTNGCIENIIELEIDEKMKEDSYSSGLRAKDYSCVICGLDLSRRCLSSRCQHLKQCAKRYGVGVRDLIQMISPNKYEESLLTQQDDGAVSSGVDTLGDGTDDVVDLISEDENESNIPPKPKTDQVTAPPKPNFMTVLMANAKSKWGSICAVAAKSTSSTATKAGEVLMKSSGTIANPSSIKQSRWGGGSGKRKMMSAGPGSSGDTGGAVDGNGDGYRKFTPDYKKVIVPPMTMPAIVDGFNYASSALSDCYFLTHFHSDHYTTLHKSFDCGVLNIKLSVKYV